MRRRFNNEDDENEDSSRSKTCVHHVSLLQVFAFVVYFSALYGLVYLIDKRLPAPLKIDDEAENPAAFIAERAQNDLKLLTDLGTRVAGSYQNEVLAVEFLQREISYIKQQANRNQDIEVDLQVVSSSYLLLYKPHSTINAYANIQNIVVRLNSANNTSSGAILLNSHFDTVPTSTGGSDDGIMVATMLEILRKLSREPNRPKRDLIFLFNGAEETGLQASHGFIAHHKWARDIKIIINLDAAGSGSKEILFQSGPENSWLLNYYRSVPHPYAQAAGEEIFQSNIVPSDTDFRIFRDFGHIHGFDFAFARNGYRYHTKYDNFAAIPLGSYQHVGDNILELVRNLQDAAEIDAKELKAGKSVYYDLIGLFVINYDVFYAYVINLIVSVLSFVVALTNKAVIANWKYVLLLCGSTLASWCVSIVFVLLIGVTVDFMGYVMSWYRNPWMILGLYCTPVVIVTSAFILLLNRFYQVKLSLGFQSQVQIHSVRLLWTCLLIAGTLIGLRTSYVLLLPVCFNTITCLMIRLFQSQHTVNKWRIIYVLGQIVPTMFSLYQFLVIMDLFIPICGRMGSNKNPEVIVGFLCWLLTIITTTFYIPLTNCIQQTKIFIATLIGIFLLFFICLFTPLAFPYSGDPDSPAPQRFWIHHTSRAFHNESGILYKQDSGFFFLNMDRNSPQSVKNYVSDLKKARSVKNDCEHMLFCGLPLMSSRMVQVMEHSTWIPAEQPIIHEPVDLMLNFKKPLGSNRYKYNFTATGPDHMNVYVALRGGVRLLNISLTKEIDIIRWKDRETFFIHYGYGKEAAALTFDFDIETPADSRGPFVDIAVAGQNVHELSNIKTPHFQKFLGEFPKWADLMTGLATYKSWMY